MESGENTGAGTEDDDPDTDHEPVTPTDDNTAADTQTDKASVVAKGRRKTAAADNQLDKQKGRVGGRGGRGGRGGGGRGRGEEGKEEEHEEGNEEESKRTKRTSTTRR
jgi:hypothetical protein